MNNKKITRATIKSFLKKNRDNIYVKIESNFNGMVDGVEYDNKAIFIKTDFKETDMFQYNLGYNGLWLVGSSRDYFTEYSDNIYQGFEVYNCCGTSIITIKINEGNS